MKGKTERHAIFLLSPNRVRRRGKVANFRRKTLSFFVILLRHSASSLKKPFLLEKIKGYFYHLYNNYYAPFSPFLAPVCGDDGKCSHRFTRSAPTGQGTSTQGGLWLAADERQKTGVNVRPSVQGYRGTLARCSVVRRVAVNGR